MSINSMFYSEQDIEDTQSSYDSVLNNDFNFDKSYNCTIYVVPASSVVFFPNLAYIYYGDKSLWWVIAMLNGILNPLAEIPGGTKIYVPDKMEVLEELTQMQNRRALVGYNTVTI